MYHTYSNIGTPSISWDSPFKNFGGQVGKTMADCVGESQELLAEQESLLSNQFQIRPNSINSRQAGVRIWDFWFLQLLRFFQLPSVFRKKIPTYRYVEI